ncbi:hypothetical protein BDV95DRAFT_556445, partial [Massariosphaeria phaeospora]
MLVRPRPPPPPHPPSNCNFPCTATPSQTCGGDGTLHTHPHISLFGDRTRFSGNTSSPPLAVVPRVAAYTLRHCYEDVGQKTLSAKMVASDNMTVEMCAGFCGGWTYFGLEYASECWCGGGVSGEARV